MEYLEEKYPEVSLMPKDLAGRAKVGAQAPAEAKSITVKRILGLAFYALLASPSSSLLFYVRDED